MHNFPDDNLLSAITKAVAELKNTLQSEPDDVIN